jgi:hypothetical protein
MDSAAASVEEIPSRLVGKVFDKEALAAIRQEIKQADPPLRSEIARQGKIGAALAIRDEHDGTGRPNFASFKEGYLTKPTLTFAARQFHPEQFCRRAFW